MNDQRSDDVVGLRTANLQIVEADLGLAEHQDAVLRLIDAYSCDPWGDGRPLNSQVRKELIPGLQRHPTTLIFLAYHEGKPVGIAVCFLGFSTFAARPLINIHDLAVLPEHRGRGVGQELLAAVERKGGELGCCQLTLEVKECNHRARRAYEVAGFKHLFSGSAPGVALYMAKRLQDQPSQSEGDQADFRGGG